MTLEGWKLSSLLTSIQVRSTDVKSPVTSCIFTLVLLFLETAILSNLYFLPVVPDLLLLYTVYVAIHRGCLHGETEGFASGILLDCLSSAPIGLNALLRTITGFVSGLFFLTINTHGFIIPVIIGFCATVLKIVLLSIISFFFPGNVFAYDLFSSSVWIEVLLNSLFAPVLFFICSKFESITAEPTDTTDSSERID